MNKKQQKEFLQAMWCALNCAMTNKEMCQIMNLMQKYGGSAMQKWTEYLSKSKQSIFEQALRDINRLLK